MTTTPGDPYASRAPDDEDLPPPTSSPGQIWQMPPSGEERRARAWNDALELLNKMPYPGYSHPTPFDPDDIIRLADWLLATQDTIEVHAWGQPDPIAVIPRPDTGDPRAVTITGDAWDTVLALIATTTGALDRLDRIGIATHDEAEILTHVRDHLTAARTTLGLDLEDRHAFHIQGDAETTITNL